MSATFSGHDWALRLNGINSLSSYLQNLRQWKTVEEDTRALGFMRFGCIAYMQAITILLGSLRNSARKIHYVAPFVVNIYMNRKR